MAKIDPTCEIVEKHDTEPCLLVRHLESGTEFHVKTDIDTARELDAGSIVCLPNGFKYDRALEGHCFHAKLVPGKKPAAPVKSESSKPAKK